MSTRANSAYRDSMDGAAPQNHPANAENSAAADSVPDEEKRVDPTALRLLNLLFMLHTSPTPLSTSQIIDNEDAGYGTGSRSALLKKLWRDRDRLGELSVYIKDDKPEGASEREEGLWAIDRARTHALGGILQREDAEAALAAIDEHFALHADDPTRWPLQRARLKLAELAGQELDIPTVDAPQLDNPAMRHIWSAFNRLRPARFTYRDMQGTERERLVEVYAIFTQGCRMYLVGRCPEIDEVRTFRTDRIVSARKTPDTGKDSQRYEIPANFSVEDYQFLPFDFSAEDSTKAEFTFPCGSNINELKLLTRNRGTLSAADDGTWHWHVDVRDFEAAASLVLEHTDRGMRVVAPAELVARTQDLIGKAVAVHVS